MPPSASGAEDEVILTPSSACRVACMFAVAVSCAAAETVAASLALRFAGGFEARADSATDSFAMAFSDALLAKFSRFDRLGIIKPATVTWAWLRDLFSLSTLSLQIHFIRQTFLMIQMLRLKA